MTNEGPSKITENYQKYKNYEKRPLKPLQDFENKSASFENRVHVKKKSLVYLWSFMLFYITLGAVIIRQIEQNHEVSEHRNSQGILVYSLRLNKISLRSKTANERKKN